MDVDADPPVPSPLATISGSFSVTFDPTLNHVNDTTGLVVHSFSGIGALDSQLGFTYVAATGEFALGGLEGGALFIAPGTNDFAIILNLANLSKPQFLPCSAPRAARASASGGSSSRDG